MKYDFDRVIDRRGTYSVKHDLSTHGMPEDIIPMWVADMDFMAPPPVIDALTKCISHGVFGYSEPDAAYFDAVRDWFTRRFGWSPAHEWITVTPGVVNAVYLAIRTASAQGDGVLIQQPVYHPFRQAIRDNGRRLISSDLVYADGHYSIDFDDFESKAKEAKLFILCSPHNPVGRVWKEDELRRMGEICLRHGVLVISDEIHQDFIYPGNHHLVFAGLDPRFADMTITCTSTSKTFNLAGLLHSNIFISNKKLRDSFDREYTRSGLGQPGLMGLVACKAAYEYGEEWLEELLIYLAGNIKLIDEFLQSQIPKIKLVKPQGTYLAWLDCSALSIPQEKLDKLLIDKARLWLDSGTKFGESGAGFQRLNAACPRSIIREGLTRLETVFGSN